MTRDMQWQSLHTQVSCFAFDQAMLLFGTCTADNVEFLSAQHQHDCKESQTKRNWRPCIDDMHSEEMQTPSLLCFHNWWWSFLSGSRCWACCFWTRMQVSNLFLSFFWFCLYIIGLSMKLWLTVNHVITSPMPFMVIGSVGGLVSGVYPVHFRHYKTTNDIVVSNSVK